MSVPKKFHEGQILFEDNHLMIINKLPSQIVQGDKTGDMPLSEMVKEYLKVKYNKPGNVFLGVVHRLDRPASGIVIFAKTGKALSRLNKMFRENTIHKKYWVVVQKAPPQKKASLKNYLKKNERNNKSYVTHRGDPQAKSALLHYQHLNSSDRYHLLEVELVTGRHHQIRVQLSNIDCIIKGDLKYGAKTSNKDASIHLHAREIKFKHPVKDQTIHLTARPPKDVLWDYFAQ